jgi:hypothetical protein
MQNPEASLRNFQRFSTLGLAYGFLFQSPRFIFVIYKLWTKVLDFWYMVPYHAAVLHFHGENKIRSFMRRWSLII